MTKQQEFRVLQTYEDFELREYLPCVIAEVKVSANYSTATRSAFSSLFNYISKGNESSQMRHTIRRNLIYLLFVR